MAAFGVHLGCSSACLAVFKVIIEYIHDKMFYVSKAAHTLLEINAYWGTYTVYPYTGYCWHSDVLYIDTSPHQAVLAINNLLSWPKLASWT